MPCPYPESNLSMYPELESFLAPYPPAIREILLTARALILAEMPGAIEQVDPPSKIIAYGTGRKYADLVFALAPFNDHVNLMFSRGAALPDPAGILQGTGKKARHVKLFNEDDLANPALRELLRTALK